MPLRPLLLALLALGVGCSESPVVSECVPGMDPDCEETGPEDDIVAGVNLTDLFARPTSAEVDAALAVGVPATDAEATVVALQPAADGARRFLLALDREGQRVVTALARVPGSTSATTPLPTVLVLPDGTDGASEADLLTAPSFGFLVNQTVQVVMAYRGEPLTVDGDAARSDLTSAPYRADVADVRAVLGVLDQVPRSDTTRVAVLGQGRGGTVGLLAAIRGADVDAVVTLGAPSTLFARSFQAEARALLLGSAPQDPYPALDALASPVLGLRDGDLSPADARVALAALSPARLRADDRLPAVLGLHATNDRVVGDDQLAGLDAALPGSAATPRVFVLIEDTTHDGLLALPAVQNQIAGFLDGVL